MPVARRLPNFELLLDDLAIRLRCLTPASALQARSHQFFGIGNEPQMAALFREVQVWWFSNELAQLDSLSRRLMSCYNEAQATLQSFLWRFLELFHSRNWVSAILNECRPGSMRIRVSLVQLATR